MTNYIIAALVVVAAGGMLSSYTYHHKFKSVQGEYAHFAADVKAKGELAAEHAKVVDADNVKRKELSDDEYNKTLAALTADNERLRNSSARISIVPQASPASKRPELACFDRAELEQATRRLDEGLSGIAAAGDERTIMLNAARAWGASTKY